MADDMGLCDCINNGIIYSLENGIVTEISLMLNSRGTTSAIETIKSKKIRNVGIHLSLQALNKNKEISIAGYKELLSELSEAELSLVVEKELLDFENKLGRVPTHIAPHQGLHGNLGVLNSLISYAKGKNIPIRIPRTPLDGGFEIKNYSAEILLKRNNIKHTNYIFTEVRGADISKIKRGFLNKLARVRPGESVEIFFHPGFFSKNLMEITSLTYERSRDIAILTDKRFKKSIEKLGFKFVPYSKL